MSTLSFVGRLRGGARPRPYRQNTQPPRNTLNRDSLPHSSSLGTGRTRNHRAPQRTGGISSRFGTLLAPTGAPTLASLRAPCCRYRGHRNLHAPARSRIGVPTGSPWVQLRFPEAPSGCHTDALPQRSKEEAERPGDGCPCVGAEETCSAPRSLGRREIPTHPAPVGTRANTVFQASNTSARRNIYTSSPAKSFSEGTQKSRRFRRISGIFCEVRPLGLEPRTH